MKETGNPTTAEKMAGDVVSYAGMKLDAAKLAAAENLSTLLGDSFGVLLLVAFGSIALMLFTAALIYWLGIVMGSFLLAIILMGCVYLLLGLVLFALRRRLLADRLAAMFCRMFFTKLKGEDDDEVGDYRA